MKKIINILCLILIWANLSAQGVSVKGKVTDTKGQPVIGAAVMLQGSTTVGAVTDVNGIYGLSIPSNVKNPALVASCIGYKDVTVPIGKNAVIDIVMEENSQQLDEVVVVGYGAMRRSDLTGAVSSVKIDDDDAVKSSSIDQLLDGKVSGVQVLSDGSNPDSGVSIRIRGMSTFSGSNEPLYVVDGVIINGESQSGSPTSGITGENEGEAESTNGLAGINPQDIESMEILKDASATAIYGSQGANGVVLITTKQAKNSRPTVRFNAGFSVSTRQKKMDALDFDGFVEYLEMLKEAGNTNAPGALKRIYANPDTHEGLQVYPVDWQDYAMRTAFSQNFYLSISGKPKSYNYLFSIGVMNNQGVIKNTDSQNYIVRLNLDKNISKKVTIGFKSNLSYIYSNLLSGNGGGVNLTGATSIIRSIMRSRPYTMKPISEGDDEDIEDDSGELQYGPNKWLYNFKNTSQRFRVNPSLFFQWKIVPWLTFKTILGGEYLSAERVKTKSYLLSQSNGTLCGQSNTTNFRYNFDNLFLFNKKWGKHSISGTLGQSLSYYSMVSETVSGWNLPQHKAAELDINSADPNYTSQSSFESISSLLSFFARAVYNYDDRYVLTATYRVDGSSKFQGRNKWAGFPSFAFAWRINNEHWFKVPAISLMKLRIGWGQVGNQSISSYQTQLTYSTENIGNHSNISGVEKGLLPKIIANPDLRWETAEQVNLGLDISFFKGRLALSVDAYNKDVKDLLQQRRISRDTGYYTMYVNQGSIRNRGIEFSLETVPVKTRNFEWNLAGNISFNKNTLLSVGNDDTGIIFLSPGNPQQVNYFFGQRMGGTVVDPINIFIQGQSMGLFYGYKTEGIIQKGETGPGFGETGSRKKEGNLRYMDLDGNGYIDENDRTIIGNPLPLFTYGFNTAFNYRGISLKVSFDGAYDFDVFNFNNIDDMDTNQTTRNIRRRAITDVWSPENPGGKILGLSIFDNENRQKYSDYYVEDASYLRLSNVALSYSVPLRRSQSKILKGLNCGLSVKNIWIFSNYSGWNASSNSFGSNVNKMGIDLNTSPGIRSYSLNLKFTF